MIVSPWDTRRRLAAAVGTAAILATTSVPPAFAVPAASAPATAPAAVRVTLTGLEPRAPRPHDSLRISGTVRNAGSARLTAVRIELRAARRPIGSRAELDAQARASGALDSAVADATQELPDLDRGDTARYELRADIDALALPGMGVYPLALEVRAAGAEGTATVGRLRTFLPYTTPDDHTRPTRLAWVWPLVGVPRRAPDDSFRDDRLATELAPGGRLGGLVAAVHDHRHAPRPAADRGQADVPVTFAVDPALLEDIAAMARGYAVRGPGGLSTPGSGQRGAAGFLTALRGLATTTPTIMLPYADPDVVALTGAGRAGDVTAALGASFRQLTASVLGTAPLDRFGWPPDGFVTRAALDSALAELSTLVLSGAALPPVPTRRYTPGAAATLPAVGGGSLRALVTDPTLDGIVAAGAAGVDARAHEQRFLAETLLITAERPSLPRDIVVAPPRRWRPHPGWPRALLRDTASVPWLSAVSLPQVAATSTEGSSPARGPLNYPRSARAAELPRSALRGPGSVGALWASLANFRSILTVPDAEPVPAFVRAVLRTESSAYRGRPAEHRAARRGAAAALDAVRAKVRISSAGGSVALASRKGTIPISVANGLAQPVRVQLGLRSNEARLVAENSSLRRIAAGHQVQLGLRVHAQSAGVFPVFAQLRTPDGAAYGAPVKLLVHSTGYGVAAVAITGGALAVLVLAAGIRLWRRVRAHRRGRAQVAT